MANDSKRVLLVEGINDESFFRAVINKHGLNASVVVAAPKSIGGNANTKNGAINQLPILLNGLADGSKERVGLVVDADFVQFGQGFKATIESVVNMVSPLGYVTPPVHIKNGGMVFQHNDGLPDFGLWVMPNNKDDGIVEDWVKASISPAENELFTQGKKAVAAIKAPKFQGHRLSKAEVATWLAWQAKPGEGLYYPISEELLVDAKTQPVLGLVSWMKTIFNN